MSIGLVERAYELARSGECANVQAIRERMASEYRQIDILAAFHGKALRDALKALIVAANRSGADDKAQEG